MRLYSFVAAAALLPASLAAHADTITQSFALSQTGPDEYKGLFATTPFDPATGTLNSISLLLTGSATVPISSTLDLLAFYETVFFENKANIKAGTSNVFASASTTEPSNLLGAETTQEVGADVHDDDSDFTSANFNVAITYNYTPVTPVAATPEPSSLALLGTGLLGAVGLMRKRFA